MSPNRGQRRSDLVAGAFIGAGLLWLIYYLTNPFWRRVCWVILIYEAYTLINRYRGDTLSESVWRMSKRPLVPYLFGIGCGWAIGVGHLEPLSLGIGFLMGHFFFQAHREDDRPPWIRSLRQDIDRLAARRTPAHVDTSGLGRGAE